MKKLMRALFAAALSVIWIGCSSAPSKSESEPTYEARLDALLAKRPDDPDLLFLRQDHKDLRRVAKLGSLRPTPVVLASVASQYVSHGLDEETIPAFRNLLQTWMECDPGNSMPLVLRGQLEISCGDLKGGLDTLVRASHLRFLRTYSREGQEEGLRIQRQDGLDEIEYLGMHCLHNLNLALVMPRVCSLLATVSGENRLRRNYPEALRLAEAEFRLARSYRESATSFVEASFSLDAVSFAAESLCELHLMQGDVAQASRYAAHSRQAQVDARVLKVAMKRDLFESPINRIMIEVGLRKALEGDPKTPGEKDIWDSLTPLLSASSETWDLYWAKLRENDGVVRSYFESQILRGYVPVALEHVTDEDRRSIESLKFPIDHFMEAKENFYPKRFGEEQRDRLIAYLTAVDQGRESELRGYFRERAARALVHHDDKETLLRLRPLLDDKGSTVSGPFIAVMMVALGDRSERVGKVLEEHLDVCREGVCWALAKLGRNNVVPELVWELDLGVRPGQISSGFQEAVTAYYALRELTGQDFGLDDDKWTEWAERTGNKKK